jgi:MscS family membrane protein
MSRPFISSRAILAESILYSSCTLADPREAHASEFSEPLRSRWKSECTHIPRNGRSVFEIIKLTSSPSGETGRQARPLRYIFPPAPTHLAAFLCAWLALSSTACAQNVSGTPQIKLALKGEDPLHRDSPQSAVLSFLADYRARNFTDAVRYLDSKHVPQDRRVKDGTRLAQQLGELLERDPNFEIAALSRNPEGGHEDGLPPDRERVASFILGGQTVALQMERVHLRSGLAVWLFSPDSVELIPKLALVTSDHPVEKHLPEPLVSSTLLDTPLWRWIALALLAFVLAGLSRLFSRIGLALAQRAAARFGPETAHGAVEALWSPLRWLICVGLFRAGMEWIGPSPHLRIYLERALTLAFLWGLAWLAAKLTDLGMDRLRALMVVRHRNFSSSVLPMVSRLVKVAILLLALAAVLSDWGYNATTIIAGLGVGSIALALAAQKTIENFFGSVSVISDRPVSVGDFCRFGDRSGTVEDIGLRSTRIRTADRTLVSVPNAQFSSMTLENFAKRDKMLFHVTLNLRRDTTPDQVRKLLESLAQILAGHSQVETGTLPVRFIGVGTYSLDVEIFTYVLTRDGDKFLQMQQDLLLQILDAVEHVGTALALPTQASVAYSNGTTLDKRGPDYSRFSQDLRS